MAGEVNTFPVWQLGDSQTRATAAAPIIITAPADGTYAVSAILKDHAIAYSPGGAYPGAGWSLVPVGTTVIVDMPLGQTIDVRTDTGAGKCSFTRLVNRSVGGLNGVVDRRP